MNSEVYQPVPKGPGSHTCGFTTTIAEPFKPIAFEIGEFPIKSLAPD